MSLKLQTVINWMAELAPPAFAMEGDPVGLQVGDPRQEISGMLVSLDMGREVLQEAVSNNCNLVITHHPLLYRPLKRLDLASPAGDLVANILRQGVSVFSAHTNLDVAPGGVNYALADILGVQEAQVLQVTGAEELEKIVVFAPRGHEDQIREALSRAGAGWIGNYSHCTFQAAGTGTFLPLEGTNPFIGKQGQLERVEEVRLETIYPRRIRSRVISQMLKAHPYEEPAYDIYPLHNQGKVYGLGMVGYLSASGTLGEVAAKFASRLGAVTYRLSGDSGKIIKKVAVCGGSGASLLGKAAAVGADLLVTGDVGYHQAQEAVASGLAVMDVGHDVSEKPVLPRLKQWLQERIVAEKIGIKVEVSKAETSPWSR